MRYWTSDLHLGHLNIREYCPGRQALGSTVDQMNEALIDRWNAVVNTNDEVWILGDLCMGKIGDTLPLVELLNGHKWLVGGNHDRWFGTMDSDVPKKQRTFARWSAEYEAVGLELVTDRWLDTPVGGHPVRVCHFPYEGDSHGEDRYAAERPPNNGLPLLCGHVHDAWRIRSRMVNVGVDVWNYAPVSETEIVSIIERMR